MGAFKKEKSVVKAIGLMFVRYQNTAHNYYRRQESRIPMEWSILWNENDDTLL
jgi:hypothetical protein